MESVESPFSLDELFPLTPFGDLLQEELRCPSPPPAVAVPSNLNGSNPNTRRPKTQAPAARAPDNTDTENVDENKKRKIIHRDVERQRRQEMAALYSALRSQLPVEYLKGKRSVSDHMHEAVNFIKQLQNKIQVLSVKRDELRKLAGISSNASPETVKERHCRSKLVVKPSPEGVQVVLEIGISEIMFSLSTIVKALMAEGLEIIDCILTRIEDRVVHKIESQVPASRHGDVQTIDLCKLQQKLSNLI